MNNKIAMAAKELQNVAKKIKQALTAPAVTQGKPKKASYLSTSSILLNLAMSGKAHGGIPPGHYVLFVGDSHSGKTWLAMSCLAEAARNKRYKDYRLIYDGPEDGAMMDLKRFFGEALESRLEPPDMDEYGHPLYSSTTDEFYFNVHDAVGEGPCIYVLDSMDALSSDSEMDKFEERKKARKDGKEIKGSYGDGKAKANASGIRQLLRPLSKTGSILIIITQTRDNIGALFAGKTRSGGHALKFYATCEVWTAVKETLYKTVAGRRRDIGVQCLVKIKKNRLTGQKPVVNFPIYHSYGLDDVGSCIDYLVSEGRWKVSKGNLTADDIGYNGKLSGAARYIEDNCLEKDLAGVVELVWMEIEEQSRLNRKSRF